MADKSRFVVHEHFVVDTKQNRHAPFGEASGAEQVAERLNMTEGEAEIYTWSDGKPKGFSSSSSSAPTK